MNRPTFHAAIAGKPTFGGFTAATQSAKSLPGHTTLKFRQSGQSTQDDMKEIDYKEKISEQEAEQVVLKEKLLVQDPSNTRASRDTLLEKPKLLKYEPEKAAVVVGDADLDAVRKKYDDSDAVVGGSDDEDDFGSRYASPLIYFVNCCVKLLRSSDSEDEDDDEDDELELQRELERIKAERAAVQQRKEQEEKEQEEQQHRESALKGNPLVDMDGTGSSSSKLKRRWNDDVVFRNQAKDEVNVKKRFINDTIRNDFHKSFLKKYVR
jgi:protein CWC15